MPVINNTMIKSIHFVRFMLNIVVIVSSGINNKSFCIMRTDDMCFIGYNEIALIAIISVVVWELGKFFFRKIFKKSSLRPN